MNGFLVVLLFVAIGITIVCAFKESKTAGLYKAFGVFGRFKAYLALDLTLVGIYIPLERVIKRFIFKEEQIRPVIGNSLFVDVLVAVVCLAAGIALYFFTWKKCPADLKSKCVSSMIISGIGITAKIAVFFLAFVWVVASPKLVTGEDGNDYMISGDTVYTRDGRRVGTYDSNGMHILKDSDGRPVAY